MSVAVILGVTGGTGAAMAAQMARNPGMDVAGIHRGRHPEKVEAIRADVALAGRRGAFLSIDASTPEGATAGAQWLAETFGPGSVSLMVHALAGASLGSLVHGPRVLSPRQLCRTFDAMAHSFVWWSHALHSHGLLAPASQILALGNPVVDSLADNLAAIAASKAALDLYVRALARELGPEGHRVNLLKFGLVDTRASKLAFASDEWGPATEMAERVTPARRLCTVEEVAAFTAVLCSPAGSWFNGANIDFTGGMAQGLLNLVHYPQ